MRKFSLIASLIALAMGTASMLRTDHQNLFSSPNVTVAQNTNAAFRDGLYLGRLAAEHGAQPHIASGRWTTSEDRLSFTAGYQQGYTRFLATTRGRAE